MWLNRHLAVLRLIIHQDKALAGLLAKPHPANLIPALWLAFSSGLIMSSDRKR
jgi:hypothetical protein